MTVEAVRVTSPSLAVTVAPPRPATKPRESGPETMPLSVATPCERAMLVVRVPPAASVTSVDCAPRPVPLAVTR